MNQLYIDISQCWQSPWRRCSRLPRVKGWGHRENRLHCVSRPLSTGHSHSLQNNNNTRMSGSAQRNGRSFHTDSLHIVVLNDSWPDPDTYRWISLKPALTPCQQQCPDHVGISWHVERVHKSNQNQRSWRRVDSHSRCRRLGRTECCMMASNLYHDQQPCTCSCNYMYSRPTNATSQAISLHKVFTIKNKLVTHKQSKLHHFCS